MKKPFYLISGITSLLLGILGAFLPLLPTTPFVLLAAFCFAKSHPEWEARLLAHPNFGPAIVAWREKGAISIRGKSIAVVMLLMSAVLSLIFVASPWCYLPAIICTLSGTWILTRPSA